MEKPQDMAKRKGKEMKEWLPYIYVCIYSESTNTHTCKGHFSPLKTSLKVSPIICGMDACVMIDKILHICIDNIYVTYYRYMYV